MANNTERIGVSYCSLIAAKTEWMFREQPIDDIGIDAHMERTDTDGKVQQLLALQIKSGESYFKENKGYYVNVPTNQVFLDDISNKLLLSYTNLPEHMTNYNFLLSQKKFMQII